MECIVDNWYIILALVCVLVLLVYFVVFFAKQPRSKQIKMIREWLLYAVIEAEKQLGGGTGKIKLRKVYGMFVTTFPWIAKVITFEFFSKLVDDALVEMQKLLENNEDVKGYVEENTGKLDL